MNLRSCFYLLHSCCDLVTALTITTNTTITTNLLTNTWCIANLETLKTLENQDLPNLALKIDEILQKKLENDPVALKNIEFHKLCPSKNCLENGF